MYTHSNSYTECNLPFGITKDQMDGDFYHYNEARDDYKLWFGPLGEDPTIRLDNFTNFNLEWHLTIDLLEIRTISKVCHQHVRFDS